MATIVEALAIALEHLKNGRLPLAQQVYREILRVDPQQIDAQRYLGLIAAAYNQRAHLLYQAGKLDEAAAACRAAIALRPNDADAHNNLGNVLRLQGLPQEAVAAHRRALEINPDFVAAHSNLLLGMHYVPGVTLAQLAAAHGEWDARHGRPRPGDWRPHANLRDPERRLRLGFVSRDFTCHPVGVFLVRCLENLDRGGCETVCYSDVVQPDFITARLKVAVSGWHDVAQLSHAQLAAQIRADGIDILFDLAGHTSGNRLPALALKPAPIQITWIGYVGTTGLRAMDYILADCREIPPEQEEFYREKVLRMPHGYVCYDPPGDAPPVGPLPAMYAGVVTFGSFNNPGKITSAVIALWAEVLRRVPNSRLLLKYRGMNDEGVRRRYQMQFADRGIAPDRIEMQGWLGHEDLLGQYNRVDLGLDPFPYSGGATTCEALWMGVPVITCPGETFAGRHSLTHLSGVGLTTTVAQDHEQYVAIAAALAGDLAGLATLRANLRQQMAASPLCNGRQFANDLSAILRKVWRQWCAGEQ